MPFLYNCKSINGDYRITKFDEDLNVESSYLCTETECECPAGRRPKCRHREMLPYFLNKKAVDTHLFFDFDRGGWVTMDLPAEVPEPQPELTPSIVPSLPPTGGYYTPSGLFRRM